MTRCYIAGPMSGYKDLNFPLFDAAAAYLRGLGHDVVNPADMDRLVGVDETQYESLTQVPEKLRQDALARDFLELCTCDAIALLPNWDKSRGAKAERFVAEQLGLKVFHLVPIATVAGAFDLRPERPATLVGISGYAQAGKDTAAQMMGDIAGFERLAFADVLKQVAQDCNPHLHSGGTLALAVLHGGWEATKRRAPEARIFLQNLGVAVREHIDPDAWVTAVMRQVHPGGRYVISDVRFDNEYRAIKERGGVVVRVTRPGTGPANAHVSECALDGHDFDAVLINDGDLDRLRDRVRLFLRSMNGGL